jgi:AraC-like DNA-binding protein
MIDNANVGDIEAMASLKLARKTIASRAEPSTALPAGLTRALTWLRANLNEPVRLDNLAQIADVHPRTLERHFRRFLHTTPYGWVRRLRLVRARQELINGDREMSVTAVALASGFSQLGRFAAQYREHFGELPSQTLKRASGALRDCEDPPDESLRLTWGALQAAFTVAPGECNRALDQVARAQELAPTYALPKAIAAWCWAQRAAMRYGSTREEDRARACWLADEAPRLAPSDAMVMTLSSGALTLLKRLDEAELLNERALALDPWSGWAWVRRGWLSAYRGHGDEAIRDLRTALHLMPFEPLRSLALLGIGCGHFAAGRFEQAALWGFSGLETNPDSYWGAQITIAASAHGGAKTEARRTARRLLKKDPDLTISEVERDWPLPPALVARLCDGLAIAGIPGK